MPGIVTATRPLDAQPLVEIDAADVRAGRVAARQASAAPDGGVVRCRIPGVRHAGIGALVVGHAALGDALAAGRADLSSAQGWAPLIGTRFGRAALNADDPAHAEDRRRWAASLTPVALAAWLPALAALVHRRVERWRRAGTIDVVDASREIAFAAVAATLGGFDDDEALARVARLFGEVLDPPRAGETVADQHARLAPRRAELEALLDARLAAPARDPPALVDRQAGTLPPLPTDARRAHLNLLLITGHETTASLLASLLARVALEPALADALAAEVGALDDPPPLAAIESLPLLAAVVDETARLAPPLVCAPRVALADTAIAGVAIPRGTPVVLGYGATNLLPGAYPDPLAWKPERWRDGAPPPVATFGLGQRLCLGMRFAKLEVKLVLATVLHASRLATPEREPPPVRGFWNARPEGPLPLVLSSR